MCAFTSNRLSMDSFAAAAGPGIVPIPGNCCVGIPANAIPTAASQSTVRVAVALGVHNPLLVEPHTAQPAHHTSVARFPMGIPRGQGKGGIH